MFDLGSAWFQHELFPAQTIKSACCGKPFKLSSGVIGHELKNVAIYVAYLPAPCADRRVVVQVRRADLDDDSDPEQLTDTFEVRVKDGKVQISAENGSETNRDVIASFTGDEGEDRLIDFIVRIDKHIVPWLMTANAQRRTTLSQIDLEHRWLLVGDAPDNSFPIKNTATAV
jgi:hypothetical protein